MDPFFSLIHQRDHVLLLVFPLLLALLQKFLSLTFELVLINVYLKIMKSLLYKQQCTECNGDFNTCTTTGPGDGAGVANADFVLYVSAQTLAGVCDSTSSVIAFAGACEMEQVLDRYIYNNCNTYNTSTVTI